mmetsp:Transcript_29147/g.33323  ORF Transcript_29147/g.33323 Transcript_29147/m.33323 type:complete len:84 (-) Transcript_29147:98-349(-)
MVMKSAILNMKEEEIDTEAEEEVIEVEEVVLGIKVAEIQEMSIGPTTVMVIEICTTPLQVVSDRSSIEEFEKSSFCISEGVEI